MPNLEDVLKDEQDEEHLDEAEAERLWAREAQQRLAAYRAGRTIPVPAQQVHAKAEKLLR